MGGNFSRPFAEFQERLASIKGYLFDWDGVFNDGTKSGQAGSPFSEVDAMGTNMLRFGHWLKTGALPAVAILTGEENPAAQFFARREHFHAGYFKSTNKRIAFEHFLKAHGLRAEEVAFVFDDVLDLGIAARCGLRLLIRHPAAPLFEQYALAQAYADYITAHDRHGVREVCELLLGTLGRYDQAIRARSEFDTTYQNYLAGRQQVQTSLYVTRNESIELMQGDLQEGHGKTD